MADPFDVAVSPMLDVPVPLMGEQQQVDVARFFDSLFLVAEKVIDVPKIFVDDISTANLCSRYAAGGTVGGSADNLVLSQAADCRANRRHSSSWWWRATRRSSRFFFPDRVQQRRLSRRSLTILLLVEVFKVFAQDRVHLHHPHLQLVFMKTQMSLVKVFFALFPDLKEMRRSPGTRVRECCGVPVHPS